MAKRFRAEGGGFSGLWEVFVARLVSSEVEGSESLGFVDFFYGLYGIHHHQTTIWEKMFFTFFRHFMQNPRIVANLWYQMFLLNKDFWQIFICIIETIHRRVGNSPKMMVIVREYHPKCLKQFRVRNYDKNCVIYI